MFITNGKSLFGNTGVLISLLILCILLYFSYNKCYSENFENIRHFEHFKDIEHFDTITKPPPKDVRIVISGSTLTVNFSIDNSPGMQMPNNFNIVLAQYDNKKNNTGNNKFYISNEYILNPSSQLSTPNPSSTETQTYAQKQLNNLCSINNGVPVCQYVFNNLDILDDSGNPYYYKLGICSVYSDSNSDWVTPYNLNSPDKLFTINSSIEQQSSLYSDFLLYQKGLQNQNNIPSTYKSTVATADGQYELIKTQLGGYPDNLILDKNNNASLSDLVDKSMVQGIFNVNVALKNNVPTSTSKNTR